jgi:transcription termination/antitermination protein NusG
MLHSAIIERDVSAFSSFPWYALQTTPNHEKLAAIALQHKGYEPYLPVYRCLRRRSDRTVEADQPLFAGYLFCRFDPKRRLPVVRTSGIISVVGFGNGPAPIPDSEIESVRTVLRSGFPAEPHPFPRLGQYIQITSGTLKGVIGILLKEKGKSLVIVSITMFQRSVSVEVDRKSIRGSKIMPA